MDLTLTVRAENLNDDTLQNITRNVCADLNRETDVEAKLGEELGTTGTKGEVLTIGAIILTLLGGGGAIAKLIGVLKAYVERGNRLDFELKKKDGTSVSLKTENLRSGQVEDIAKGIAKAFGASE